MFIRDLAAHYVLYLRNERRLAKSTVRDSRFHLRRLREWLETNGDRKPTLKAFSENVLRRFFDCLRERGLRPRTSIASYPMRALGEWLVEQRSSPPTRPGSSSSPRRMPLFVRPAHVQIERRSKHTSDSLPPLKLPTVRGQSRCSPPQISPVRSCNPAANRKSRR